MTRTAQHTATESPTGEIWHKTTSAMNLLGDTYLPPHKILRACAAYDDLVKALELAKIAVAQIGLQDAYVDYAAAKKAVAAIDSALAKANGSDVTAELLALHTKSGESAA